MIVSERYDATVKIRRRNDIRVKRQTYNKTVTFYSDRKEKQ